MYNLSSDLSDIFQCGKCRRQFYQLEHFLRHKTQCYSSVVQQHSSLLQCSPGKVLSSSHVSQNLMEDVETALHNAASSHNKNSTNTIHHQNGKLMIQTPSGSQSSSSGSVPTQHARHSPLLTAEGANSILSEADLLSLTSSLDANMMVSLSNSISPSSLLHLQGGDVSSNTDDFASFHQLTDSPTGSSVPFQPQSSLSHHHMDQHHPNDSMMITTTTSNHLSGIQSPQSLVNSLIYGASSITSPNSFSTLIHNFSDSSVDLMRLDEDVNDGRSSLRSTASLLKTSFDPDLSTSAADHISLCDSRYPSSSENGTNRHTKYTSTVEHRPNNGSSGISSDASSKLDSILEYINSDQSSGQTLDKTNLPASSSSSIAVIQQQLASHQPLEHPEIIYIKKELIEDHEESVIKPAPSFINIDSSDNTEQAPKKRNNQHLHNKQKSNSSTSSVQPKEVACTVCQSK